MRFLDIIIPEYNCPQEYMIRLLNSINRQKNINFNEIGIIIVNDCSKIKYKKSWFKQRYPKLNILYLIKDVNEGQGLTRQYGCDNSEAEYITYIDQDDELYGDVSLFNAISLLKERKKVFAITSIYEEVIVDNKLYFKEHSCFNFKSLHGLFIKREYLKEINLRFHKDLRQYEDVYYLSCLFYVTKDFDYFNFISYIWKYNENSQVREKSKYTFEVKHFNYYYLCSIYSIEFLFEHKSVLLSKFAFVSIYGCLLILNSKYFSFVELVNEREEYLNKIKNVINKYENIFKELTNEDVLSLKNDEYNALLRSMPELEKVDEKQYFNL